MRPYLVFGWLGPVSPPHPTSGHLLLEKQARRHQGQSLPTPVAPKVAEAGELHPLVVQPLPYPPLPHKPTSALALPAPSTAAWEFLSLLPQLLSCRIQHVLSGCAEAGSLCQPLSWLGYNSTAQGEIWDTPTTSLQDTSGFYFDCAPKPLLTLPMLTRQLCDLSCPPAMLSSSSSSLHQAQLFLGPGGLFPSPKCLGCCPTALLWFLCFPL